VTGKRRRATPHPQFDSSDALLDAPVVEELDLHGFTAVEAPRIVRGFLEGWHRRGAGAGAGAVVHIITGRGKGSKGAPVLRRVVAGLLQGELRPLVADWALDDAGGGFKVRLR